jgi:polysaccharide pyruvyl transferase WcaK-like protein
VEACARDSFLSLWEEMGRADLLLSGGGGLLQTATSQLSLVYYLSILDLALRRGTPYLLLGQGLGPLRGPGVGWAVRRYLERAEAVVLRDPESVRLAREMGVGGGTGIVERGSRGGSGVERPHPPAPLPLQGRAVEITEAADLALLLEPARAEAAENLLRSVGLELPHPPAPLPGARSVRLQGRGDKEGPPICGMILRGWGGHEPWEAAAEACDYWAEHLGVKCLLLPFAPEDRALAWRVSSTAISAPAVLDTPVSPAEMLALIGRLEMVVTMRLHGLIFAAAQQVPALGLSYDPKVTAFAAQAAQRILPLEGLSALNLRVAGEDLWASREAIAPARAAAAGRLREKAEVNWRVLEEVAGRVPVR